MENPHGIVARKKLIEVEIKPGGRISRADCARMLDLTPRTLISWEQRGIINPIKIGGRVFYDYNRALELMQLGS